MDVTLFDMTGISETNQNLCKEEREIELQKFLPKAVLADYERYASPMNQFRRFQRHPWIYKLVWFLDRCLFKVEKRKLKKSNIFLWN